ncbi:MAG: rhomboid family intramembrane serine protease, partial [Planctomycetota bacterium]
MFIPVGTDAPIYHFPFATIGLIVANVGIHIGFNIYAPDTVYGASGLKQDWSLWFGEGLHPLQWVTSCFLHLGWLHLIGNMVFLWGFGIIVEGKLGWWRFLALYLAVGAIACGIEQTLLLHGYWTPPPRSVMEERWEEEGFEEENVDEAVELMYERLGTPDHFVALGASGAIFGLVAISMIWAPKNELDIMWLIWRFGGTFEVPILTFSLFYIGLEAAALAMRASLLGMEYAVSSAFLHTMGAAVGGAAGAFMLKKNWVDCENWDLFAVMNNTHGNRDAFESHARYTRELTVPTQVASGADGVAGEDRSRDAVPAGGRRKKKRPKRKVDTYARLR